MNIDYKLIGARIKALRQSRLLTQAQIAEEIGVSVGYISQIERGTTKVNLETLASIANVLTYDISDFIGSSNSSSPHYLEPEFFELYKKLTDSEKDTLHILLSAYINKK